MATYFVKPPGKNRRHYAIIRRDEHGSPQVFTPALTQLNKRLDAGEDGALIRDLVYQLKDQLARGEKEKSELLGDNLRLAHQYLEHIRPKIELNRSPYSARREVFRAVEAAGPLPVDCVDPRALQTRINSLYKGEAQRRVVRSLNSLLRYLGKTFKLVAARKEARTVAYITIDQFLDKAAQEKLPEELKALFGTLFGTGCRMGEAFKLRALIKGQFVDVSRQLTQGMEERGPKRDKIRKAAVLPEFREHVVTWIKMPGDVKQAMRLRFKGKHLSTWTKLVWNIRAHDLRHSYAVRLAECGASITQIARNLGNSEAVVREYYLPFIQTDTEMEAMERLFKSQQDG